MKLESKIWYDREYICFAPTGETEREEMEAEGTSMPVPAFRHPGPSTPLLQPSPASSSCHAFSLYGLFNCIQSSLLHTIANAVFPLSCCSCPWQAAYPNRTKIRVRSHILSTNTLHILVLIYYIYLGTKYMSSSLNNIQYTIKDIYIT